MRILLIGVTCLLMAAAGFAAQTVTVVVGHQCCGGCATALVNGVKKTDWVAGVKVDETTTTITAKDGKPVELIALMDNMYKAGFPAKELPIATEVTLAIGHLCCGGCVENMKASLKEADIPELDKTLISYDAKAQAVTLRPVAGKSFNLVTVLRALEDGGNSALTAMVK